MKPPIEPYRSINGMNNLLMALLDLCYYSIMLQCSRIDVKAPEHFFLKIEPMLHLFRRYSIQFKEDVETEANSLK